MIANDGERRSLGEVDLNHVVHFTCHPQIPLGRGGPHVVRHRVAGPHHVVNVLGDRRGTVRKEREVRDEIALRW